MVELWFGEASATVFCWFSPANPHSGIRIYREIHHLAPPGGATFVEIRSDQYSTSNVVKHYSRRGVPQKLRQQHPRRINGEGCYVALLSCDSYFPGWSYALSPEYRIFPFFTIIKLSQ